MTIFFMPKMVKLLEKYQKKRLEKSTEKGKMNYDKSNFLAMKSIS